MPPQFPDFRRIRRRVKRSLNYGMKKNASLNLPLQDMVVNYFDRHSPYDYMRPEISANISHRGYADPCTLIVAMIYLDRLRTTDKEFFESSDPADLYLPALVLASKYLHDADTWDRATNSEWAEAADIEPEHLNTLEWDFIKRLNWNTIVKSDEFDTVLKTVECYVANYNVENSGVATYNDLVQLAASIPCSSYMAMLRDFLSFIGFIGLVYTLTLFSVLNIPTQIDQENLEVGNVSTSTASTSSPVIAMPRHVPHLTESFLPHKELRLSEEENGLAHPIQSRRRPIGARSFPSQALNLALSKPIIILDPSSLHHHTLSILNWEPFDALPPNSVYDNSFLRNHQVNLTEICA